MSSLFQKVLDQERLRPAFGHSLHTSHSTLYFHYLRKSCVFPHETKNGTNFNVSSLSKYEPYSNIYIFFITVSESTNIIHKSDVSDSNFICRIFFSFIRNLSFDPFQKLSNNFRWLVLQLLRRVMWSYGEFNETLLQNQNVQKL